MKRLWSILLALTLVLGMVPAAQAAEQGYTDTANHWAETAITKWSDAGILQGSNGKFSPDDLITRAELAVVLDRVMRYQEKAPNVFTDLPQTWYTDAILRANAAGILQGDGQTIRPLDNVTRQEVAAMVCRGLKLAPKDGNTGFADDAAIGAWAKGAVKALADRKLLSGTGENLFDPTAPMTRASVVKLLDNAIKGLYTKAGEYSADAVGTVVVSAPGVTLKNMKIDGDLIIAEGVGEGEVHLDNITVTGDTIVKGGGEHSIYFNSVTVGGALIVNKVGGNLRIVATGTTSISVATLESGAILITKDLVGGGIETVEIPASVAAGQKIVLEGDFKKVENSAKDVTMSATGKIAELVLNEKTTVEGSAKVEKVTTAPGADSVVNGKPIEGGKTQEKPTTTPPSGGSSSGDDDDDAGGGGGDTPSVSYTVTFHSNGGSAVGALSNITPGSKITKPADPTKTEQEQALSFLGWFKDPALTQPWEFGTDTVSASMTLYAKWSGWQAPVERDARFAEGYPKASFNYASGNNVLELKVKLTAASAEAPVELFSTVNQINSGFVSSSLAVIHGHADDADGAIGPAVISVDEAQYLVISDTDEHTIPVANRNWDMQDMDISFVLQDQNAASAKPTVVTFNGTAMAELDTYAPHFASAYLNTAKNKVVLWFGETLDTKSVPAPSAFTLSTGTVSAVTIPTPDPYKYDGCVELTVSGIGEIAGLTVTYTQPAEGAAALQDSATTPNKVATFGAPQHVVSAVPAPGAVSVSSDLAYIHATISPCPRFTGGTPETWSRYTYGLKYGTDASSAAPVAVGPDDMSMSHSPSGYSANYFFEIQPEAVPAAVEGGKYFVTLTPTETLEDCAGDRVSTPLELVGTPRATPEGSLQPTVTYDSTAKELQVVFPADHGLVTSHSSNCFFTITCGGKDYILRGGSWWSGENTCLFRTDAFPFGHDTFSWDTATLRYSTANHPNASVHDILHFDSGKPYAGFADIDITVSSAP